MSQSEFAAPVHNAAGPRRQSHVWHQLTNATAWAESPGPYVVRAEGSFLFDAEGRRIIDGNSGLQNVTIGHGRPEMAAVAASQIAELDYFPVYNGTHPRVEELADLLHERMGAYERFVFMNSGSEAVEATLKLLREYWLLRGEPERTVVVSRFNSFHGGTLGALGPTGRGRTSLREPFAPFLIEAVTISDPIARDGEDDAQATARLIAELREAVQTCGPQRILGLFAEPIQQQDVPVPPAGYWSGLRAVCDELDIPLVADEVITGFGRTGTWLGTEHWDVTPDVAVLGKGLASGYAPISAVGVTAGVAAVFDAEPDRLFHNLSTTAGHPVCCALASENVRILEREGLIERSRRSGELLRGLLRDAFADRPYVARVTGEGMLNAVVFHPSEVPHGLAANGALRAHCLARGAYIRVDGQMWFIPPLTTDDETLEQLVAIAVDAADAWLAEAGR